MIPTLNQISRDNLREWQKEFFFRFSVSDDPNYLLVATPGAGKTVASLTVAHENLYVQRCNLIIVVCPTESLKYQWAEDAGIYDINLNPEWESGTMVVPSDYHGICVTYQQISMSPRAFASLCQRYKVFVIFDEIHHAGDSDGLVWGRHLKIAFDNASKRLSLSGTPFRTDNSPIPFIKYEDGKSVADYSYTYAQAISDGVCRPVFFPSYEGKVDWFSSDGDFMSATFRDTLSHKQATERLRVALDISSGWLTNVLEDAHKKVLEFRQFGHSDAAGLVIAKDVRAAQAIADYISNNITKHVVVVTSDDKDAPRKIRRFKSGKEHWIVAVKMVSEGIDIRRLRVCVYATNYSTEMFFRQAVGRIIRNIGLENDDSGEVAYFYIPRDDNLIGYAQQIKEERNHQLLDTSLHDILKSTPIRDEIRDKIFGYPVPISGESKPDDVILPDDKQPYSQREIADAERIKVASGLPAGLDTVAFARSLRMYAASQNLHSEGVQNSHIDVKPNVSMSPLHEQKKQMRNLIKKMVSQLHIITGGNLSYQDINFTLMRLQNNISVKDLTLEQMKERFEYLKKWIEKEKNGQ